VESTPWLFWWILHPGGLRGYNITALNTTITSKVTQGDF
jgi:hypothetical protein